MIENNILGKDGLTITSANHLANIAKEMYEALETKLESLKFYNKDFTLAVNGNSYRVENESDKEEFAEFLSSLKEIGELKGFIGYLREAIKAKAELELDIRFEEHIDDLAKEGRKDLERPDFKSDVTFEDELLKLTSEQRARYYALEAKCAAIGEFIHNDGGYAKARKEFFEITKNPTRISGRGQEAEICNFTSSYSAEEIDSQFFELQKEYRNCQAEFNKMKAELEQKVKDANIALATESLSERELWLSARKLERAKYDEAVKSLKVIIPQNLRGIYEKVNKVANAK
ncbi:MAG: hypothetical protein MJZ16_03075 [Bacteroidales bacterium]|nr:hypothetical protein [Bacteroidales bacterium]